VGRLPPAAIVVRGRAAIVGLVPTATAVRGPVATQGRGLTASVVRPRAATAPSVPAGRNEPQDRGEIPPPGPPVVGMLAVR
jgi:hypothetical protein